MTPFVLPSDDLDFASNRPTAEKCLLLSPPSLSSHPDALTKALAGHDRNATDLQMLDRLAAGLISLPISTYGLVTILSDADGTRKESQQLLSRDVMSQVYEALVPGGKLQSQDNTFGSVPGTDKTEAILAGLISNDSGNGMIRQADTGGPGVIMLTYGKKKTAKGGDETNVDGSLLLGGKRKAEAEPSQSNGIGFVDFGDDLDNPIITGEDDELIDEDDLLTEEDMIRGVIQPVECRPKAGKRRRACKDCTCGLKEKIEAEDADKRADADSKLQTLRLGDDEMAEVDFTVQGKVGSCGNCALGDAFRCDGCPYIGLPAFKPGEEVRLLNNDIQL